MPQLIFNLAKLAQNSVNVWQHIIYVCIAVAIFVLYLRRWGNGESGGEEWWKSVESGGEWSAGGSEPTWAYIGSDDLPSLPTTPKYYQRLPTSPHDSPRIPKTPLPITPHPPLPNTLHHSPPHPAIKVRCVWKVGWKVLSQLKSLQLLFHIITAVCFVILCWSINIIMMCSDTVYLH